MKERSPPPGAEDDIVYVNTYMPSITHAKQKMNKDGNRFRWEKKNGRYIEINEDRRNRCRDSWLVGNTIKETAEIYP